MPNYTLTDTAHDLWVDSFSIRSPGQSPWSVTKRTLRGGRREGVDLIEVDNGALAFSIVPTRGMGLWKGRYQGLALGWDSPVRDGPVNPAFVNLMNWGGLGWLEGFDELLARCGLENNGAPYTDGHTTYGLHGKIANLPAHFVALHIGDVPNGAIRVEGHVDESKLFSTQVRMVTTTTTVPGAANWLTVRDEFRNLSDQPQEMRPGSTTGTSDRPSSKRARRLRTAKTVVPHGNLPTPQRGSDTSMFTASREPGFAEQVYLLRGLLARQDRTRPRRTGCEPDVDDAP